MIKLYALYNGSIEDLTNSVTSINSTGDKAQAARKIDVALAYPIWDNAQPRPQVSPGTRVWMLLDGKEVFRGIAWDRVLDSADQAQTFTAYDYLIYLTKSKVTYNFVNVTPEEATRTVCAELGITAGSIASTGIKINRLIAQKTGYETIMEMYTQASKTNGKLYIPVMDGTKLSVIEKGSVVADYTLKSRAGDMTSNVISTNYRDTMDSMVNKVKIYDDKNAYVSEVSNSAEVNGYGLLQDNYTKEADKDSRTVATGMLTGIQQDVTIPALGNWDCRTGYAVNTEIVYVSNLQKSVMYIDGDTHTWVPGTGMYTMSLNLSYKNLMDGKE